MARTCAVPRLQVLVSLGPAFVKIGQALSSRPDVLPPAYLQELEKLQDRIPPFSTEAAFEGERPAAPHRRLAEALLCWRVNLLVNISIY